jgi:hypothetical protein
MKLVALLAVLISMVSCAMTKLDCYAYPRVDQHGQKFVIMTCYY